MSAPYNALDVANYAIFVDQQLEDLPPMSHIRIQEVLYFIQIVYLRLTGKLFFADKIEAFRCGPMVPTVFNKYYVYGSRQIFITDAEASKSKEAITDEDQKFIKDAVIACGKYGISQLAGMIYKHDAWSSSYNSSDPTITEEKLRKQANQ